MSKITLYIIIGAIIGVALGIIYHFLISTNDDIIVVILIAIATMLAFLVIAIFDKRRKARQQAITTTVDDSEVNKFIEAIGGIGNIISTASEASRVKISLSDIDLIDQDKVKALELDGVFLSGNQMQVTFGKKAEGVAMLISDQVKEN